MTLETFGILLWMFVIYSILGWILETVYAAVRHRKFINRGFLNGPLCAVYGFAAVLIGFFLRELEGNWFFLFLGSSVIASLVELWSGLTLQHFGVGRWWDYSNRRFNLGGYICLESSLIWGALGVVSVTWINPLLLDLFYLIPGLARSIILIVLAVYLVIDFMDSVLAVFKIHSLPKITQANDQIEAATQILGHGILKLVVRRLERAHPDAVRQRKKEKPTVFAQGCGFQKLVMLLVIGAFLGAIVEAIFCRITGGAWMSRSSLVCGQFSMVWGLALAGGTAMMYRYKDRSDSFLFMFGFLAGGVFEYICSVFTEIVFGSVFWDYSTYPFNLGGRINLLYCFFWGIAAVLWLKYMYPRLSAWLEKIPMKFGNVLVWCLTIFLVVDVAVSGAALIRYDQRADGVQADNAVIQWIDETFHDEWMEHRYQNMRLR